MTRRTNAGAIVIAFLSTVLVLAPIPARAETIVTAYSAGMKVVGAGTNTWGTAAGPPMPTCGPKWSSPAAGPARRDQGHRRFRELRHSPNVWCYDTWHSQLASGRRGRGRYGLLQPLHADPHTS